MTDSSTGNRLIHKEKLFDAMRNLRYADYEEKAKGIEKLKEESKSSKLAIRKLKELLFNDDACVRILAAEALSITGSFPDEVVPFLKKVLKRSRTDNVSASTEPWLRRCLSGLYNYGALAMSAERTVWMYLYGHPFQDLKMDAAKVVSRFASKSVASWTILALLCRHRDTDIRHNAKAIVASDEFKNFLEK